MNIFFTKIVSLIISPVLLVTGFLGVTPEKFQDQKLGATIPVSVALFETSLANSITSSATSMTLVSATTKEGSTLATGTYAFIIDEGTASEEFVSATCVATACSSMTRGLSILNGTSTVASLQKAHRRGASVKITDAPQLLILSRILNGDETIPNIISYTSHPTFTSATSLVDKGYVDGVSIAGAPDMTTSVKGIAKISTAPASSTSPIVVGDNDSRVSPVSLASVTAGQVAGLAGNAPSATNTFMTFLDATSTSASSSMIVRYTTTGQITATTTPVASTDAVSKAYSDLNIYNYYASTSASTSTENPVIYSLPAQITVTATSAKKFFEMSFNKGGTIKTEMTIALDAAGGVRIYKNGVAVGTDRTGNGTYVENISFVAGDLIQIYGRTASGSAYLQSMKFYASDFFKRTL